MAPSFRQLRHFCELAAVGHFGRAAERLNISQPPLSRQIAALELDLGAALFVRSPKGVTLTAAGRMFLADATEILRLTAQAKRNVAAAGSGETGSVSVGFTMCAAYSVVPDLARRYQQAFPKVDLRVRELLPNALESGLKDGSIDVAISFPGSEVAGFEGHGLLHEPLKLVLSQGHRLAKAKKIRVEDLAHERFLIVPRNQVPALYDSIVQRCRTAGFDPIIGLEVYLQQTIVNFVAGGLGIALVPASMQSSQIKGAVFKEIADPPMIDQFLYWSPDNKNPCLLQFLAISKNEKRSNSEKRRSTA
jgi:DNA-binding transcriptional LysR family regulator